MVFKEVDTIENIQKNILKLAAMVNVGHAYAISGKDSSNFFSKAIVKGTSNCIIGC